MFEKGRRQAPEDKLPSALRSIVGIESPRHGRGLAPSGAGIGLDLDQDSVSVGDLAVRNAKWFMHRDTNPMKANPLTAHVVCGGLQLWTFLPYQFMRLI